MIPDRVYGYVGFAALGAGAYTLGGMAMKTANACLNFAADPYKATEICRNAFYSHRSEGWAWTDVQNCQVMLRGGAGILGVAIAVGEVILVADLAVRALQDFGVLKRQAKAPSLLDRALKIFG